MGKNMTRLSKRAVDASKPETAKYILWDTDLSAFGLRVMPSGTKSFILRYRIGKGRNAKGRLVTLGKVGELTCEAAGKGLQCGGEARARPRTGASSGNCLGDDVCRSVGALEDTCSTYQSAHWGDEEKRERQAGC